MNIRKIAAHSANVDLALRRWMWSFPLLLALCVCVSTYEYSKFHPITYTTEATCPPPKSLPGDEKVGKLSQSKLYTGKADTTPYYTILYYTIQYILGWFFSPYISYHCQSVLAQTANISHFGTTNALSRPHALKL